MLAGFFALGMTLVTLVLYFHLHKIGHVDRPYRVAIIGVSHALLILAIEVEILQHTIQHEPFEWWLSPFAMLGFAGSIWALVEMLRSPRLRGLHNEVQAHRLD
jgi:hypothetical protein